MADVLVVGAGPTGLALALLLAHHGVDVRIIERALERSPFSKALAVNARTQELLRPTGVTAAIEEAGHPVHAVQLHGAGRSTRVSLSGRGSRGRRLLALPQGRSEKLLESALAERGVVVDRGVELVELQQRTDATTCGLPSVSGGPAGALERVAVDVVVGAGNHSGEHRVAGSVPDQPQNCRAHAGRQVCAGRCCGPCALAVGRSWHEPRHRGHVRAGHARVGRSS